MVPASGGETAKGDSQPPLTALAAAELGVALMRPDGQIEWASRAAEPVEGVADGLATGSNYLAFLSRAMAGGDPFARRALDGIRQVLAGHGSFAMSYPAPRTGGTRWFLLRAQPAEPDGVLVSRIDLAAPLLAEAQRMRDRERYEEATLSGEVGVWEWALASGHVRVDRSLLVLLGYADAQHPTRIEEWLSLVHQEDLDAMMAEMLGAIDAASPRFELEHRILARDGAVRWLRARGSIARDDDGRPRRIVVLATDITRERQSEVALAAERGRYRRLFEVAGIALWTVNISAARRLIDRVRDGRVPNLDAYLRQHPSTLRRILGALTLEDANEEAVRLFDAPSRAELLARPLGDLILEAERYLHDRIVAMARGQVRFDVRATVRTLTGHQREILLTDVETDPEGETLLVRARDAGGARDLAAQFIQAQEAERSRVARELHDDVLQSLASLSMTMSDLRGQVANSFRAHTSARLAARATEEIAHLSTVVRQLSHEMHPGIVGVVGLVPALASLAHDMTERHGLQVITELPPLPGTLAENVALAVYRAAQEALLNVVRHAAAPTALLSLIYEDDLCTLVVMDEGKGFDPARLTPEDGLGLISIRERAKLVGGTMTISSSPGAGTELRFSFPLPPAS